MNSPVPGTTLGPKEAVNESGEALLWGHRHPCAGSQTRNLSPGAQVVSERSGGDQRVAAEDRAGEEGGEGLPTSGRPVKGAVEDGKDRRTDPNSQTCGDVERAFLAGE